MSHRLKKPPGVSRRCAVPRCGFAYFGNKKNISFFKVPKDPDLMTKWKKAMSCSNLRAIDLVCESHFEERFIMRNFEHVVNGEVVVIPRGKPSLTADAVPTIFPNYAKQVSAVLRGETGGIKVGRTVFHKVRTRPNMLRVSSVKPRLSEGSKSFGMPNVPSPQEAESIQMKENCCHHNGENNTSEPTSPPFPNSDIFNVDLPSPHWTKINFQNTPDVTVFAWCNNFVSGEAITSISGTDQVLLNPEKSVVVEKKDGLVKCTVFIKGLPKRCYYNICSNDYLQNLLNYTDNYKISCEETIIS